MEETGKLERLARGQMTASVVVPAGGVELAGDLSCPPNAKGLVVFAHGSGSSRFSPRNTFVARCLNERGIATLLIDLLTASEEQLDERTRELRFDILLLAERLAQIGAWALVQPELIGLKLGYFGASTGGAAALIAAARQPDQVAVVVSRGGRPDLAKNYLSKVQAPTLLIVGAYDSHVLAWNREALTQLNPSSRLYIVPSATHLFEEPGALESVAHEAGEWFCRHFKSVDDYRHDQG